MTIDGSQDGEIHCLKPGKPAEGAKKLLQEHTEALDSGASDEDPFAEIDSEFSEDDGSLGSSDDDDEFEFPSSDEGELYNRDFTYGSADYPIML